jgi:peptidoglycan/LPS O-acetylase OafA/YrhL
MNFSNPTVLVILGIIAVIGGAWIAHHFFSADARRERGRRRSNARVSSTAKRPMVRFSVRTKKERRK